jgi:hypothetical protein
MPLSPRILRWQAMQYVCKTVAQTPATQELLACTAHSRSVVRRRAQGLDRQRDAQCCTVASRRAWAEADRSLRSSFAQGIPKYPPGIVRAGAGGSRAPISTPRLALRMNSGPPRPAAHKNQCRYLDTDRLRPVGLVLAAACCRGLAAFPPRDFPAAAPCRRRSLQVRPAAECFVRSPSVRFCGGGPSCARRLDDHTGLRRCRCGCAEQKNGAIQQIPHGGPSYQQALTVVAA